MIYIVGRGRRNVKGNKNIPINKNLLEKNVIFIDLNEDSYPDYCADFIDIKYNKKIKKIFLFDWSTFYCSCIKNINKLLQKTENFTIYVPLDKSEITISDEILDNKNFTSKIIKGNYPLFDWKNFYIDKYINPCGFIQIKPKIHKKHK